MTRLMVLAQMSTINKLHLQIQKAIYRWAKAELSFDPSKFPNLDQVKYNKYLADVKASGEVALVSIGSLIKLVLFKEYRNSLRDIAESYEQAVYDQIMYWDEEMASNS